MIALDEIYFDWLMYQLHPDGVGEGAAYACSLLHGSPFTRRVGHDINRAVDGANLRLEFFDQFSEAQFNPTQVQILLDGECSWLEMLIALCRQLDYLYEGGVDGRLLELLTNMGLDYLVYSASRRTPTKVAQDRRNVMAVTTKINTDQFNRDGVGGIFPLQKPADHPDQREVEIWDQHAAYFRERLEGVLWTSTN